LEARIDLQFSYFDDRPSAAEELPLVGAVDLGALRTGEDNTEPQPDIPDDPDAPAGEDGAPLLPGKKKLRLIGKVSTKITPEV